MERFPDHSYALKSWKITVLLLQIIEEIVRRTCWDPQHHHLYTVSPDSCIMRLQAPVDSEMDR